MNPKTGGYDVMVREKPGAEWKVIKSWSNEEQGSAAGFGPDANTLYLIANDNANALRLVKYNLATGKEEVIAEDKEYDVSGAMIDDQKRIPLAVSFTQARTEWKVLDDSVKADFDVLAKVRRGDFSVTSTTTDMSKWVVAYTIDDGPVAYYLYDRPAKKAEFLFVNNSKLEKAKLAQMEPISFKAKDGLTIHGYLTKPVGVEPKNLPTVLLVHGGPWARDNWGYNPLVQFLANRGYAVLQVNFRGSTGYGKSFLNAGNREWAGKMHQDLVDAKEWVVKQGVADPKQGRDCRRQLRRLRDARRPHLHAGRVRLRRGHRRPEQHRHAPEDDPAVLGADEGALHQARRRPGEGRGLLEGALAAVAGQLHHQAAPDRPGGERSAREGGRERPDRQGDARQRQAGGVRALPRRGARLRAAREPAALLRGHRAVPGQASRRPR